MQKTENLPVNPELDLVLEKVVDIPRHLVWKAWTQPEIMKQWFAPLPWTTVEVKLDVRPGGIFRSVMRSPEGQEFPGDGCILEAIENEKLVWTSALGPGFRPTGDTFMTAIIKLEDHPKGTKYTAHILHKDAATRKNHEEMGFHQGWSTCLDQLVALMKKEL